MDDLLDPPGASLAARKESPDSPDNAAWTRSLYAAPGCPMVQKCADRLVQIAVRWVYPALLRYAQVRCPPPGRSLPVPTAPPVVPPLRQLSAQPARVFPARS